MENGESKFSKKLGSLKPEPADARSRVVGEANASAAARQVQKVPNSLVVVHPPAGRELQAGDW